MKGEYGVVYVDPPWYYPRLPGVSAADHYPLMRDQELLDFTVARDALSDEGVLFMWATCPRLDMAMRLGDAWGLRYVGVPFVWVKTRRDGVPIGAKGPRARLVTPQTEMVTAWSRNKRFNRPVDYKVRQTILEPPREHSRKPDVVIESIERLYPDARKFEVFSRQRRDGWDCWGNEVGKFE